MTMARLVERPSPLSQLVLLFRRRRWLVDGRLGWRWVDWGRPSPSQPVLPFRRRR
ncbi:MAG: hypothetical protein IPM76_10440 [Chloroflexi bacterium]|nr:hypothetical protein [Chloroflexota bacterium]